MTKRKTKTKASRRGGFQPGQPRPAGAGRKKGTPNRFTGDIRQAILDALKELGGEKWLAALGRGRNKGSFATLLGKAMPLQMVDPTGHHDPDTVARKVRERLAAIEDATAGEAE